MGGGRGALIRLVVLPKRGGGRFWSVFHNFFLFMTCLHEAKGPGSETDVLFYSSCRAVFLTVLGPHHQTSACFWGRTHRCEEAGNRLSTLQAGGRSISTGSDCCDGIVQHNVCTTPPLMCVFLLRAQQLIPTLARTSFSG